MATWPQQIIEEDYDNDGQGDFAPGVQESGQSEQHRRSGQSESDILQSALAAQSAQVEPQKLQLAPADVPVALPSRGRKDGKRHLKQPTKKTREVLEKLLEDGLKDVLVFAADTKLLPEQAQEVRNLLEKWEIERIQPVARNFIQRVSWFNSLVEVQRLERRRTRSPDISQGTFLHQIDQLIRRNYADRDSASG